MGNKKKLFKEMSSIRIDNFTKAELELAMAAECTRRPDLKEGIRARLVDRDQSPNWSFSRLADVPEDVIEAHFQPEWDDSNDPMQLD